MTKREFAKSGVDTKSKENTFLATIFFWQVDRVKIEAYENIFRYHSSKDKVENIWSDPLPFMCCIHDHLTGPWRKNLSRGEISKFLHETCGES